MRFGGRKASKERRKRLMKAADRENRKRWRRYLGTYYGNKVRFINNGQEKMGWRSYIGSRKKVVLKDVLCFADAPKESLDSLLQLDMAGHPESVFIDMKNLKYIDATSLLILASKIEKMRGRINLSGNWPSDKTTSSVLFSAGFDKFLGFSDQYLGGNVKLITGRSKETSVLAMKIKSFLMKKHPNLSIEETDNIGMAVNELLENVKVHAFDEEHEVTYFAVGLYDSSTQTSTISILDMGKGVSATVREKIANRYLRMLGTDAADIEEAVKGIRTRTKNKNRGKGFSSIRGFVEGAQGRNMIVVSGRGMVKWSTRGLFSSQALPFFRGTVVTLSVRNSSR